MALGLSDDPVYPDLGEPGPGPDVLLSDLARPVGDGGSVGPSPLPVIALPQPADCRIADLVEEGPGQVGDPFLYDFLVLHLPDHLLGLVAGLLQHVEVLALGLVVALLGLVILLLVLPLLDHLLGLVAGLLDNPNDPSLPLLVDLVLA